MESHYINIAGKPSIGNVGGTKVKYNTIMLKWSLLLGSIYFFGVAVVHMIGFKIPILFIYYNVPSYAYQDRLFSVLAFGWSAFFFTAFTNPRRFSAFVKAILTSGAYAIVGLSAINVTTDFNNLNLNIKVWMFWIETAGLFVYWLLLLVLYFRSRND